MKEDKFIDSLFEAAKNEPSKTSLDMVSSQFTASVGSTNWWLATKSAFVGNIYLNSVIAVIVIGTLGLSLHNPNEDELTEAGLSPAQEVELKHWDENDHTMAYRSAEPNRKKEISIQENNWTSPQLSQTNSKNTTKKQNFKGRNNITLSYMNPIIQEELPRREIQKFVNCDGVQKLEVIDKYFKHVLKKDAATQLYYAFDKKAGELELDEFIYYLDMNGINVDIDVKYNKADSTIKKLEMEVSDNEGYVQRILSIGFDVIELYWKTDSNGYPYDLQIAFDNGDLIAIDLTDERFPLYKYVDRN